MIKIPKNLLTLNDAARKYGLSAGTLKDYVNRKRLEAVKLGRIWCTSDEAMKAYLRSRHQGKRKRDKKRH